MWISRKLRENTTQQKAERGSIVLSGNDGVEAAGTIATREVATYMPYGYSSVPPVGEEAMLLPSSDGQVLIGTRCETACESGEIIISSLGGARIELKNDGSIVLNSLVIDKNGVIQN